MKPFKVLTEQENKELLKFPIFISLLAANRDNKLDNAEKESAIEFSHIKTFSCDSLLTEYYKQADKFFENNIALIDKELPKEISAREVALIKELATLEMVVLKLGEEYMTVFHHSMKSFKEHVSRANRNVLIDFVFPMSIKGLTD